MAYTVSCGVQCMPISSQIMSEVILEMFRMEKFDFSNL